MQINTRELGFVNYNGQEMNFVKYNGVTVYEAWKKLLASGIPPLTLLKCKQANLVDYKVYGESIQDGTPTPDTPIEVESVGERTVNLVKDVREVFKNFANYEELEEDGRQCIRMRSNGGAKAIFDFTFKENTQYTISFDFKCKYSSEGYNLAYDVPFSVYYTDGNSKAVTFRPIDNTWQKCVFVSAEGKTISHIKGIGFHWVPWNYIDINTFQIQEGAVATEYEPYGYKIPVVTRGVNLINIDDFLNTALVKNNDGTYTLRWNNNYRISAYNYNASVIKAGSKITIKHQILDKSYNENFIRMMIRYTDGTSRYLTCHSGTSTWEVLKDVSYMMMYIPDTQAKGDYITFKDFIICYSNENVPYEQYVEPVTTNIYLDEPLRRIGDYADYIDFENSKIVRNTFMRTYDGISNTNNPFNISDNEENFAGSENHGDVLENFWLYTLNDTLPIIPKNGHHSANDFKQMPICLQLPVKTGYYDANISDATVDKEMIWFCQQGRGVRLYLSKDRCGGKRTDILNYLRSNPITVLIATYTPYTEDIDLPNIPTHKGTTILEVDTTITPSNMEVIYLGKK